MLGTRRHLKPARPGLRVLDPARRRRGRMLPMPPEGYEVKITGYWLRLMRDGDVVEAKPPAKKTKRKEG